MPISVHHAEFSKQFYVQYDEGIFFFKDSAKEVVIYSKVFKKKRLQNEHPIQMVGNICMSGPL